MQRAALRIVVLGALLAAVGGLESVLDDAPERREAREERPFADLPPDQVLFDYVGTRFLGSLRSIVVSALWLSVARQQDREQYDEMLASYELIARLQPHLDEVWTLNAHNMAYNLSWQQVDRELRWMWVEKGIRYLEEGQRRNPRSTKILFELGNFAWHRVPFEEYLERRYRQVFGAQCFERSKEYFVRTQEEMKRAARKGGKEIDYLVTYQGMTIDSDYQLATHSLRQAVREARQGHAEAARGLLAKADRALLGAHREALEVASFSDDAPFWRNRAELYRDLARTRTVLAPCFLDLARAWVEAILADPASPEARWPVEVIDCARRKVASWRELSTDPLQYLVMQVVLDSAMDASAIWDAGREEEARHLLDERAASCERFAPGDPAWAEFARGVRGLAEPLAKEKEAAEAEDPRKAADLREDARKLYLPFLERSLRLDVDELRARIDPLKPK